MDSYTAIETMLQRRGYTGSVKCSFKEKFHNRRGLCRHYKWGSWPAKPSLRESFDVYGSGLADDSEAFSQLENMTWNLGVPVLIRARRGRHGTEFSVAGGPWSYRLKSALDQAGKAAR